MSSSSDSSTAIIDPTPVTGGRPGWATLLGGRNALSSLMLAGGVALHATNVFLTTTMLPSIVRDIGGLGYYAWNTTLFVIASIIGATCSARLLQALRPRGAYVTAAILFALGALVCGFAPAMPVMLVGRTVQGLGGGLLISLSYAMIRILFPQALWPRAMALVSGMWGIGTLVGPAIGGVFAELDAWRSAFHVLIPLALTFAAIAALVLPREVDARRASPLPVVQMALLSAAVLAVSAGSLSTRPAWNIAGLVGGVALSALVIVNERRGPRRLLPEGTFGRGAPLMLVYGVMSLLALTVTSDDVFVPLFLQVLHGQSPLIAGYLSALMAGGWTVGSVSSSNFSGRTVQRIVVIAPCVSLVGSLILLALMPTPGTGDTMRLTVLAVGLFSLGLGVGMAWPHLLTWVLTLAAPGEQDRASASITTVQLYATAVGAAVAGLVANTAGLVDPGGLAGTSRAAFALFVVFCITPALCIALAVGLTRRVRRLL
ncbi:MFS transporter [Bradyrhizobium sp. U87765 SZCCT0131]|uniref:MFS transporter n=1 Tax=unclassified Bradyrhizobium TaxID=2631580 RepID=UPI001BA4FCB3|nr:MULTISPECIES: MFS transporter [unclassified Bradyrhizobium]MBR1217210.1 MFS transporter [Bradyrhizobium sp. U87765 SZCCT0131]MBR1259034.1 MFS transporter [Bradyrhizobium sp. U87765 SZCCT0134]MBR1305175.1 MFS transporter [Bradyrhizobium sp. U87765 SZCCT0110]MBR1320961.1 MFS transporter [Bradyrhizobium sp. U87765 SZCCT0109]MBR1350385.1 MFS transporter [Bradyrhizobium sp. U87765 SZCCT0048]